MNNIINYLDILTYFKGGKLCLITIDNFNRTKLWAVNC